MTDDVRPIDDAEALKVWSELSELDPKLRVTWWMTCASCVRGRRRAQPPGMAYFASRRAE
eukprot:128171-Amphidinium_carterae.1